MYDTFSVKALSFNLLKKKEEMVTGMRRRVVLALAFAALALITSCSGEDGAMGPAGPPGPVEPSIYGLVVRSNYEAYYDVTELINCQAIVNVSNIYTVPL